MIPLPDDHLLACMARGVRWLKTHPEAIGHLFHTATRETSNKMRQFLTTRDMHVVLGYPRDQTALPAFSIIMAPETEVSLGIGDEHGTFDEMWYGATLDGEPERELSDEERRVVEAAEDRLREHLESTNMRASYRVEC